MKARVKATGALLIVRPYGDSNFDWICDMGGENGTLWKTEQLEFIDDFEPDYWEKLKHQYAGMAMQGMMNNSFLVGEFKKDPNNGISDMSNIITKAAVIYATTLVNRLKEEEK